MFWTCPLVAAPSATPVELHQAAASAVRQALSAPGVSPDAGVQLIASDLADRRLTLDFSRELLAVGLESAAFEDFIGRMRRAVGDVLREALPEFEVYLLIEGVPLQRYFSVEAPPFPLVARQLAPPPAILPSSAALTGRRIAISPGHGYYLNGTRYVLQREYFSGIVEDFVNHDIVTLLNALLLEAGADVRPTRALDRSAGLGETGFPRWQEAARYHVKALGADASVWNESGFTHLEQDIRCRPRYANAVGAELLVSIHNNGGGGTGTETLYDTNNGFAPESKRLADILHARVIAAIRRDYNPAWTDRRVQGFNGSYGENRLATRPAVIMEIAFMDKPTPDNAALQDERFKLLVATAVRDGIREFLEGPLPAAPSTLLATGDATGISLSWVDSATNETGFVVERRSDASASWSALTTLAANTTTHRDTTAAGGTRYLYRVKSYNAAGDSATYSNEAATALSLPPAALVLSTVSPSTVPARDWDEELVFTLTVADNAGRPVSGITLLVQDGLRNASSTAVGLTADATGQITFRSTVPSGQADGRYAFTFQATKAGFTASPVTTREVQVRHPGFSTTGAPTITAQPASQSVIAGSRATFSVSAVGAPTLAYQWRFRSVDLAGATTSSLILPAVTSAQAGDYSVTVSNQAGTVTSLVAALAVNPSAWLSNVSLRTTLATGQNVIVGFVVNGGSKDILVRAAGPALAAFGLTTAMADPRLELYRGAAKITENNDWPAALAPTVSSLGAFPFPVASRDAAFLQSLGGPHTVQATGTTGGVVLVEGYDAGSGSAARLVNLSARNRVGAGADILIAGFSVAGTGTQRVLIRAVGPTLASLGVTGVLADPQLELTDAAGTRIATNDNWDAALSPTFAQVGAFPLPDGSKDAAVVATVTAGRSYTVQVSGVNNGVGEALVEVYEVP